MTETPTNVTRDVIEDLLPLYVAGEASRGTRALVEASLKRDPDLARLASGMAGSLPEERTPKPLGEDVEMRSIRRTRNMLTWKSWLLGLGILFSLLPFSFAWSSGHGFRWLVIGNPPQWPGLLFYGVLAAACWIAYFTLRRRLA